MALPNSRGAAPTPGSYAYGQTDWFAVLSSHDVIVAEP